MTLDKRLQAVADFVPKGCKVADIGTDHGYLAKYLYEHPDEIKKACKTIKQII